MVAHHSVPDDGESGGTSEDDRNICRASNFFFVDIRQQVCRQKAKKNLLKKNSREFDDGDYENSTTGTWYNGQD
jgi:hypothetical protein